ncbi:MAG: 5'/3'-nucleotidase SurE [Phycisphaerales bacterium]|nr:5'/3'-nucleotidase SurE [Phycisphaerales bacterium]
MRILLTNDDGIRAPGLAAMHEALDGLGEIFTVAPKTVQSATGHGITFTEPLMVEQVEFRPGVQGMAVDGRPADCVKLAIQRLWPDTFGEGTKPDLTVSGINSGANVGINILYSGTVAAAIESAFLGVPSIATSLHMDFTPGGRNCMGRAAWIARQAIDRMLAARPLNAHEVVNINVPRTDREDAPMPPIRVAEMDGAPLEESFERRTSPGGQTYYWIDGDGLPFKTARSEGDIGTLRDKCVTLTPLSYLMTDTARVQGWRDVFDGEGRG